MNIKNEQELIAEANGLIINKDLEQAYKILTMAEVYTAFSLNSLFLIAQLSMSLKKTNKIPGHIIVLKVKRDEGVFTEKQENDFMNLLREYQKLM